MAYWKFHHDYLDYIEFSWNDYIEERKYFINNFFREAADGYKEEAEYDLRNHRYSRDSIQAWYDDKMYELKKWRNDCLNDLEEQTKEFKKLYRKMMDEVIDSSFFHYEIVYDFKEFTRKVYYSSTLDSYHFRIKVLGQSHWYSYGDKKEEAFYKPDNPTEKNIVYY